VTCVRADPTATFGERLRAIRLAARLTKLELTIRAGLGDPDSVARYEAGLSRPRAHTLAALVRVLGPGLLRLPPAEGEPGAAGVEYCREAAAS
jgi:transcriptional regulator with XRE-family HTH domain